MTDPTRRNRLDEEGSPYLRQHADNPVNWQPWDETAREAARERDVPIFLSVGYAACHWCHVMEEESFEDERVAELLNEGFVPVKVDREERPDVDRIYQTICQRVTGHGGWPLSVWLTPEGKPFYVGTYFPPEPKRGQPGFIRLLRDIREAWTDPEERGKIEDRAEQWTQAIAGELEEVPDQPGDAPGGDTLETAAQAAVRGADREHGGWGRGQKFPHGGRLHILGRAHDRAGREEYRAVLAETLDAMADRGLYDHVGGGFHRYTTDREWVVPHFEKMLYDNAEIPRAMLAGYQLTGRERYAEAVRETVAFLQRELQHPGGGFYSTLDARSAVVPSGDDRDESERGAERPAESAGESGEQEEGAFYVWTPVGVHDAVAEETDADLFCDRFGVTEAGNFEGGQTVLTRSASVADLAAEYDLSEDEVRERLERARKQVFEARADRPRPARDEKILAGWNGLAVSMLAEAGLVLDDEDAAVGADALGFVHEHLWDTEAGRLQRRYRDGETKVDGYLEDYAFLGRAAFDLYQVTGDVDHLAFALELAEAVVERFWDGDAGTLYFTPAGGEQLIARPQEVTDQSTPSSAGVAASLLLGLDHFRPDDRFEEVAGRVLETHGSKVESNPLQHASLTLAADTYANGALELTLVADDPPAEWDETLADQHLPARLLAPRPADESTYEEWLATLDMAESPPVWTDRSARDGEPTVYACRSFTCSPPQHDLETALSWADEQLSPEN
ncbi:thioredoxin domain-containing protein [Halobacteriales archaeon SW_10_68_16]|nr:MAG: thioredoxin domain-containing protein [Halobacteriales archaeon SW_10_68_16]